jgi:hypothetical protein
MPPKLDDLHGLLVQLLAAVVGLGTAERVWRPTPEGIPLAAPGGYPHEEGVAVILLLLLLIAILFGLGFVVKWLFILAAVLFVLWLAGWLVRPSGGRWYYW